MAVVIAQPVVEAVFVENPPLINGILDDEIWTELSPVNQFVQREPATGDPVTEKTEFFFCYDNNNLYIGVKCYSDPSLITAKEMARDVDLGNDDRIQVILDTYLDKRNAYWFQIGPRGSIGDALISENGHAFNKAWDGLWTGKATIHDKGWDAEISIPFKTLGFKKDSDTWGLKLIRHIRRKSEISYWPETSIDAPKFMVSDAGLLTGFHNISQGAGLDIVPFSSGGVMKTPLEKLNPFIDGGLDAFYQITPSMKAAVTVNTDFAQTESDDRKINLTRFSLFFPEKRDFFIDGASYFNFGINGERENPYAQEIIPFFTRRIGLDETGNPVRIHYGGKFTGQTDNWNIGFMHIRDEQTTDPLGYTIGRLTKNIGKQSSLGFIATNGNAISSSTNSLIGIDLRLSTSEYRGNKNLVFNLYGMKSFTSGIKGGESSYGTEVNYPNDLINFRLGYMQVGENFKPGLGYLPRNNISHYYGSFGIGPRPKKFGLLQIKSAVNYSLISDLNNGKTETAKVGINLAEFIFLSSDKIKFSSQYQYESLIEDFTIFSEHIIPSGDYSFVLHLLEMKSAERRKFWAELNLGSGSFYGGTRKDIIIRGGYKIMVPLYVGLEADRKYINIESGSFIANIYRANMNILFSPAITLYSYLQYDNLTEALGWQSRFRWIISPGKEVFLVWNSNTADPLERFKPETYDLRFKVKYTVRF